MAQAPTDQDRAAPTHGDPLDQLRETTDTFRGVHEDILVATRWTRAVASRGTVAIVHGWGEHPGRYTTLVDGLTRAGFAVHGFDQRGHGRSPGQRGHFDAWSDVRDDVAAFLAHVRAREAEGQPLFLYGHSYGGALVLEYCLHVGGGRRSEELRGVVASSPALVPQGVRSPVLERLASVVSRIRPTLSLSMPLEREALARDPALVAATNADPLSHRRISARATTESLAALAWIRAHAGEWRLPLLLFHGTADRIIDSTGSVAFAHDARAGGAPDVTLRLYEGVYHEPHNDLDAAVVVGDIVAWLERHV